MKLSLTIVFICLIFTTLSNTIHAYYITNTFNELTNGESYTLEIKASPENNENGVKINLITKGIRITNFEIFNAKDYVIVNPDCNNGEFFTDNRLCVTLVKDSSFNDNESLGFLTFKVLDSDTFSILKAEGSSYSNGESLRSDLDTVENKVLKSDESSNIITIGNLKLDTNNDILIFSGIGLIVSITFFILSMILILFRRKNNPI